MRPSLPSAVSTGIVLAARFANGDTTCATGLYMIVARGSDEPPGVGDMGAVANATAAVVPGSVITAVTYPATLSDYFDSEAEGVGNLSLAVNSYVSACPSSKIALLGYSQGAQVTADYVCGGSEGPSFDSDPPASAAIENNIVAILLFGDPSFVANLSYDAGTSEQNGLFPRENLTVCESYASKIKSYCDTGDVYCADGNDTNVHQSYFDNYTAEASN